MYIDFNKENNKEGPNFKVGDMLLVILTKKKWLERFTKKNYKKAKQKELRIEKVIKRKAINYMLNRNARIILLTVGLIKRDNLNE